MSKKLFSMISFVLLTTLAASALAADVQWNNFSGDRLWRNPDNWDLGYVPTSADKACIRNSGLGPIIDSSTTAVAAQVVLSDWSSSGDYIDMTGGSLTTSSWFVIGYQAVNNGTFNLSAGTVSVGTDFLVGNMGAGTLNMTGGSITVTGLFGMAQVSGGAGDVFLDGGTISCGSFDMASSAAAMDITDGTLIVNDDATSTINTYISNGWLTAYGGSGVLQVDYNVTNPNKTTVIATTPEKASYPSPTNGATGVDINADLSWTAGVYAVSHDVYFGTDFSDVNSAARLPGDLDGSGTVDYNDLFILTDYWVQDPFGSDPYAGINDDNIVDFCDYALLAQDFSDSASAAFKGNQPGTTYDPNTLELATTYYWRIDEVNDANPNSPWTGDVWSFTTYTGTANFRKGPYLLYPGDNTQMQVLWQMDEGGTPCTIEWGTDTTYSDGNANVSEYGTDHQYSYTIGNLTPGTMYYYRVTAGATQYTGNFTAAPATSATDVKFLMYGDTRTYPADHDSVAARMIATYNADPACQTLLLLSGDWVNTNSETDWTNEFFNYSCSNIMENLRRIPINGCMGNHEGGGSVYMKYWPYPYVASRYWSFDYGPAHIVILDQYTPYSTGSAQYNWLVNDLSTSTKDWKIIVLHEPGWSAKGGHNNNTEVQNYIHPLCTTYGVQIVLGGHNHYYARGVVDGVYHLTSGGGGAPLYTPKQGEPYIVIAVKTWNFQKVEISGNSLTCTTLKPDGTAIDTFTVTK